MTKAETITEQTGLTAIAEAYHQLLHQRPGVLASESGGELAWLKKARERDALRWQKQGLPNRASERWKYTSLASIQDAKLVLPKELTQVSAVSIPSLSGSKAAEIVFVNGHYRADLSKNLSRDGISVSVLSKIFDECVSNGWSHERLDKFASFRTHLETSDADHETVFAAMNTSFMQDAVLIDVTAGTVIREPIVVTWISESKEASTDLPILSPRVFMHLRKNAQAGLIEVYSGSGTYLSNAVSDVRVDEGARLSYSKLQIEGGEGSHIGTTRIHQKRDSFSEAYQFSFGAKLSRQDLHISLEGQGAETVLDGLYMVTGKQHVDNYTLVDHLVPHTTSQQLYKGILDGESRAVFNGHIRIHRDAQKSNAAQTNNNLVLSSKAEVDTKPELEIDADDVKGAHGATIGQIDPEHVFYLQARAISRDEAVRMLALGFAQDVVFRIRDEAIRNIMKDIVAERFQKMNLGSLSGGQR